MAQQYVSIAIPSWLLAKRTAMLDIRLPVSKQTPCQVAIAANVLSTYNSTYYEYFFADREMAVRLSKRYGRISEKETMLAVLWS